MPAFPLDFKHYEVKTVLLLYPHALYSTGQSRTQ